MLYGDGIIPLRMCRMYLFWIPATEGIIPDSKVHGANMGPIWGWQNPGGPHVGRMNFAIWDVLPYRSPEIMTPLNHGETHHFVQNIFWICYDYWNYSFDNLV